MISLVNREIRSISQTVTHSCLHSKVPIVITKKVCKRKESAIEGFIFVVGVDGSNKSHKALNYAINLASGPKDQIVVCYAPTPDKIKFSKTVKAKIEDLMELVKNVNWKFVELEQSYNPAEKVVNFSASAGQNEESAHFVVIGNNGYRSQLEGKEFFGRTAETIVRQTLSNVIIIT